MKLTWFGGRAVRIHIGGRILITEPGDAAAGVAPSELRSGADQVIDLADIPPVDLKAWRPRKPGTMLDEADTSVGAYAGGGGAVLIDAIGEPPLLLLFDEIPEAWRWSGDAVVVLLDEAAVPDKAVQVLDSLEPRLIAVTGSDQAVEAVFGALRDRLNGTALVTLEPGMALEV